MSLRAPGHVGRIPFLFLLVALGFVLLPSTALAAKKARVALVDVTKKSRDSKRVAKPRKWQLW